MKIPGTILHFQTSQIYMMKLSVSKSLAFLTLSMLMAGCAMNVSLVSAELKPAESSAPRPAIAINKSIEVQFDTGYSRTLHSGSQWARVGTMMQGEVYKPLNTVLVLEGAHMHEAWLVIADSRLVGFYLPVERGFSALRQPISLDFSPSR